MDLVPDRADASAAPIVPDDKEKTADHDTMSA